jgi:hypothetical protein
MPGHAQWLHFLEADDLAHLLERMRLSGLDFWLDGLGSAPAVEQIQPHLVTRGRHFVRWLGGLLPPPWREVTRWLQRLPVIDSAPAGTVDGTIEIQWWRGLLRRLPATAGQEQEMLRRLRRDITDHLRAVARAGEQQHARHPDQGRWMQWQLRTQLEHRLRGLLLFGHPFHAAFVLAYGLLEAIQLERMRALVLARQAGWPLDARLLGTE